MKAISGLLMFLPLAFAGCSTSHPKQATTIKDEPETVLVTYHVKQGMEMAFESLLRRAWKTYRTDNLVLAEPHVVVREAEEGNTTGYIEIFTWVSHAAPMHTSADVKEIWAQETALCQARSGHTGIGGGEVEPIIPPRK